MKATKKILFADDDLLFARTYHRIIERAGFICIEAHDGEEAIKLFLTEKPDLVILDMNMPKKSGLAVLKEVRDTIGGKNLPIIMFTGKDATDSDLPQLAELKPTYYIVKGEENLDKFILKIKELTGI